MTTSREIQKLNEDTARMAARRDWWFARLHRARGELFAAERGYAEALEAFNEVDEQRRLATMPEVEE